MHTHKKTLFKKRSFAFGIDLALVIITNYMMTHLFSLTITRIFYSLPAHSFNHMIKSVWNFSHFSVLALAFAYFTLFNYLNEGKTFGKVIFDLKVKNNDGSPLTLSQSMCRAALHIASFKVLFFIFYMALMRKDSKTLSDLICKTSVDFDYEKDIVKSTLPSTENLLIMNQISNDGIFFDDEAA